MIHDSQKQNSIYNFMRQVRRIRIQKKTCIYCIYHAYYNMIFYRTIEFHRELYTDREGLLLLRIRIIKRPRYFRIFLDRDSARALSKGNGNGRMEEIFPR